MEEDDDEDNDDWMYESVESGRRALSLFRVDMKNLLKDWDLKPFRAKELLCNDYLHFLFMVRQPIHIDKSDVTTDLNILEMLQKLDSIIPDNDFRKWIQEKLGNMDLQRYLEIVDSRARYLPKEFADQLKSLEELNVEINVENPDDIRNQLSEFLEEEESVCKRPRWKEDCVPHAPHMFRSIEDVMCKLRDIYSEMEMKEERLGGVHVTGQAVHRAVHGVQPAIQADDGVKLPKPVEKGQKRRKMT